MISYNEETWKSLIVSIQTQKYLGITFTDLMSDTSANKNSATETDI